MNCSLSPALFCAPTALVVARLSGAKAWLHVQDFEVDAAFDLGLLKGQRIRNLVAAAERWLMRRFDVVSTISQRMHQRLLAKGVDAAKARMAVNWVDMAQFALPSVAGVAAYRQELNIPEGATVALYSGNMGGKLASARPVVATAHVGTELANVVQTCGLVVPPEDPAALAQAIHTLAADTTLRERLGAAGYVYAQAHLDREAVLERFEADVKDLLRR